MKKRNDRRRFAGAAEVVDHAMRANEYLKQVCAACEAGDKAATQRALRLAVSELETARTRILMTRG
jgi:hypothetical protein